MQQRKKRIEAYLVLSILLISAVFGCGNSLKGLENLTADQLFEQGKTYYDQEEYKKSLQYFLYIKDNFVRSPYAGPTRFYAGESYFALGKYEDAAIEYKSFLSFFPNDPNAVVAQYKLGVSYFEQSLGAERDQTMLRNALAELRQVAVNYPENKEYGSKAEEAIRNLKNELALHEFLVAKFYRKEKRYPSSTQRLIYIINTYPDSNLHGDALFLLGLNYLDADQPEDAKNRFIRLIQAYPANQYVAEAQKKLAKLGVTTIPTLAAQKTPVQEKKYLILKRDGDLVMTDIIRNDGIHEGMILEVYRKTEFIGTIRILEIHENFSVAEIESSNSMLMQVNDTVLLPK